MKSVNLGAGKNTITVTGGTVSSITGGSGVDAIDVSKQKKININAGSGNDSITVNGIDNSYFSKVSTGTIRAGAGSDTITINKGGFYKIDASDDNDVVKVTGGSNIVSGGNGKDTITINSKYANAVDGGPGNDRITLSGKGYNSALIGGNGNDTIIVKNTHTTDFFNVAEGNSGNDTYHVYSLDHNLFINNGPHLSTDVDVLNIHCSRFEVGLLNYDPDYDALVINGHVVVAGVSSLSRIIVDGYEFTASEAISAAYYIDTGNVIGEWINEYNSNLNKFAYGEAISNDLARRIGYKGK